jgi:RNA polymerase sigma-70 factor, ECF subfamily
MVMSDFDEGVPRDPFAADIAAARQGCEKALDRLFRGCRAYLLMVANQVLPSELRAKTGPSDLVQETFLQVKKNFGRFRGSSEGELLAWLRGVLLNNVHDVRRHFLKTEMRQIRLEVSLDQGLSDAEQGSMVDVAAPSPGSQLVAHEEAALLKAALGRLSPDYRRVIVLRNWEEQSFAEIGAIFGRSPEAARKLWARAIEQLKSELRTAPERSGENRGG